MLSVSPSAHLVPVQLGPRSYDICVERGLLVRVGQETAQRIAGGDGRGRSVFIITQPNIAKIYGQTVTGSLEAAGFTVHTIALAAGETRKTLRTVEQAYSQLRDKAADRRTVILALGGGVIGDIAGFVAATYNRGLDFVQIPTTLLAQVDSSVGGKVGVNFGQGKNLIGSFYQPRFVAIDPDTLATLPLRERRSGLAEVLKYGIIDDKPFLDLVVGEGERLLTLQSALIESIIAQSCRIKARVVEQDEQEGSLRAILNFGHTIGHALEGITQYKTFTHGEAIALGMVSASLVGEEMGITSPGDTRELTRAFLTFGFETQLPPLLSVRGIAELLALDKKSVGGAARFVLMDKIGHVTPGHDVPQAAIERALTRQQAQIHE